MKGDPTLRDVINRTGGPIFMVYELEAGDQVMNWLHEGLSHECWFVWQLRPGDVLRPFQTKCKVHVTTHINPHTASLFMIVPVPTTCLWCLSGMSQ